MNKKSVYTVFFTSILMSGTAIFAADDHLTTPPPQIRKKMAQLPGTDDIKQAARQKYEGSHFTPDTRRYLAEEEVEAAMMGRELQKLSFARRLQAAEQAEETKRKREVQQKLQAEKLAELQRKLALNLASQEAEQIRSDKLTRHLAELTQKHDRLTEAHRLADEALAEKDKQAKAAEEVAIRTLELKTEEAREAAELADRALAEKDKQARVAAELADRALAEKTAEAKEAAELADRALAEKTAEAREAAELADRALAEKTAEAEKEKDRRIELIRRSDAFKQERIRAFTEQKQQNAEMLAQIRELTEQRDQAIAKIDALEAEHELFNATFIEQTQKARTASDAALGDDDEDAMPVPDFGGAGVTGNH